MLHRICYENILDISFLTQKKLALRIRRLKVILFFYNEIWFVLLKGRICYFYFEELWASEWAIDVLFCMGYILLKGQIFFLVIYGL